MFSTIRTIICVILFIIALPIFKKYKVFNERKKSIVWTLTLMIAVPTIIGFVPFENIFVTFDSPENVYTYINGKEDIKLTIEGNNSDLVIGYKDDIYTYLIVPKTSKGWKIDTIPNNRKIIRDTSNGNIIHVDRYKNTNDYYITVYKMSGKALDIRDSSDSKFYSLEKEALSTETKKFITYYAHIKDFDSNYWISIDNKKINLF